MKKEKITKWFLNNFDTHSDWTGTKVETKRKVDSVTEVIRQFFEECFDDID